MKTVLQEAQKYFPMAAILIPPNPPLRKGLNYRKLLVKSPFEKGGLRGI